LGNGADTVLGSQSAGDSMNSHETQWWATTTSHQAHSDTHAYHKPGSRLPLHSTRPAVTFLAIGCHHP